MPFTTCPTFQGICPTYHNPDYTTDVIRYIQMDWIHTHPDDPIQLYSEIGEDGYETRRIDIYRDGRTERVSEDTQDDYNFLSPEIYSSLEEFNGKDEWDEVKTREVTKDDFEIIWAKA